MKQLILDIARIVAPILFISASAITLKSILRLAKKGDTLLFILGLLTVIIAQLAALVIVIGG